MFSVTHPKVVSEFGQDTYVELFESAHPSPTSEVFLFLHGFPSLSSRNEDLIQALVTERNARVYLLHYRGLAHVYPRLQTSADVGQLFDFDSSIAESAHVLSRLQELYGEVIVIAHSWGGYVAYNLLNTSTQTKMSRLILLAPYTHDLGRIESADLMDETVKATLPQLSKKEQLARVEQLLKSWNQAHRDERNPSHAIRGLNLKQLPILILQGDNDPVVKLDSVSKAAHWLSESKATVEFDHWPEGHWFNDHPDGRTKVITKCLRWLKKLESKIP